MSIFGRGTAKIARPSFSSMGFGTRIAQFAPRIRSNSMLLSRFLPDTMDVMNNTQCALSGGSAFTPHCLSIGLPRTAMAMPKATGTGFGGLTSGLTGAKAAVNTQSVWGLYDTKSVPQMFVVITERNATVGTTSVKFVDAEFSKTKLDAMTLDIYKGQAAAVATVFPTGAGYAKITWQKK